MVAETSEKPWLSLLKPLCFCKSIGSCLFSRNNAVIIYRGLESEPRCFAILVALT